MKMNLLSILSNKWLFWAYLLVILLLVALPLNSSAKLDNLTIISFRGDYFFHTMLFIPWAFFYKTAKMNLFWWFLIGMFFAGFSEGLQYFLPYRAGNPNDMLSNLLGIIIGTILFLPVKFRYLT